MTTPYRPNIIVSGLTAAGKTTHSHLLASWLGYDYVAAIDIILQILDRDRSEGDDIWFHSEAEIISALNSQGVDDELDRRLVELCENRDGIVFDSWALAWIKPRPAISIWIESDRASRTRKCFVSQADPHLSADACGELVDRKDYASQLAFASRYGIDLFQNREPFDIIANNSTLIPEATRRCADLGIESFDRVMKDAVASMLQFHASDPDWRTAATGALNSHPLHLDRLVAISPQSRGNGNG